MRGGKRARSGRGAQWAAGSDLVRGADIRPGALTDPHLVYVGAVAPQDHAEDLPAVLALLARPARDSERTAHHRRRRAGPRGGHGGGRTLGVEDQITVPDG